MKKYQYPFAQKDDSIKENNNVNYSSAANCTDIERKYRENKEKEAGRKQTTFC